MKIALAQKHYQLGDIAYNQALVQEAIQQFSDSDLIVFPELFLTGYPPEDLLLRHGFYQNIHHSLEEIHQSVGKQTVLLGMPRSHAGLLYNSCAVIDSDKTIQFYDKQFLPNYSVFDEKRYFKPGTPHNNLLNIDGRKIFICICEDVWHQETFAQARACGAELIISMNASPYYREKFKHRLKTMRDLQKHHPVPFIYLNCVGGQDELVFDGNSFILNAEGELLKHFKSFEDEIIEIDFDSLFNAPSKQVYQPLEGLDELYTSLVKGLQDYFQKNHLKTALIGLSGGIDSALAACIAVDALGAENVHAVSMPSQFTSEMSETDAKQLADNLGIQLQTLAIEEIKKTFLQTLDASFANKTEDLTEENLQARIRGTILMALSNKHGHVVLTTSNKSETAVGYSTLYGDTAGGFCVIKDVYKTEVYQLAEWINQKKSTIPERIITRAPSAELSANQTDQDSLPPYEVLDPILKDFIEYNMDISELAEKYGNKELIQKIVFLVKRNEYKRRQSPPGVKTTKRAFGRDWRYPISENYLYQ